MEEMFAQILAELGEDPTREGLSKTPARAATSIRFLTRGYAMSLEEILNEAVFEEECDEMVVVRDIELYSLCEHHMLPFVGKAHVAYVPDGKIVGLSKIPRIVEMYSRRLQVQERLTVEVANAIEHAIEGGHVLHARPVQVGRADPRGVPELHPPVMRSRPRP
jgi:GTP cyclohydrolase I